MAEPRPHVKVVIVPADQPHVAIMNFELEGEGNVLPPGAAWLRTDVWIRAAEPALIEERIQKWRALDSAAPRPQPLRWYIADAKDIPEDRTYRNAQVAHPTEAKVVHDMPLARELHKDMLRNARVERMLQLDRDVMAAQRNSDKVAEDDANAEKQVLLDATDDPRIEAATTVEELKAVSLDAMLEEAQVAGRIATARTAAKR